MNIGQIGNVISTATSIVFSSYKNLFEFDMIILDLNSIPFFYPTNGNYRDPLLYIDNYNSFISDCERRFNELQAFVANGKKLIIILPVPQVIGNSNSFTQKTNIELLCPFTNFTTRKFDGKIFELNKSSKLYDFFAKYKTSFIYGSYINETVPNEIAKIKELNKCISFYQNNIIYLPDFNVTQADTEWKNNFIADLFNCFNIINSKPTIDFPNWFKDFNILNEAIITSNMLKLSKEITHLQESLREKQSQYLEIQNLKILLSEDGQILEQKIEDVFKEFGIEILETKEGRDDLILKYNEQIFVVEIKGLKNSAAEKNAAQLEKWVTEYLIANEIKPKGILIVNAYKEKSILDRNETPFPHQMLQFSINREHCLITTTQLLGALIDFKNGNLNVDDFINSLISCNGIYPKYTNYKDFIKSNIES